MQAKMALARPTVRVWLLWVDVLAGGCEVSWIDAWPLEAAGYPVDRFIALRHPRQCVLMSLREEVVVSTAVVFQRCFVRLAAERLADLQGETSR